MLEGIKVSDITRKILEKEAAEAEKRRQERYNKPDRRPEGGRLFDIQVPPAPVRNPEKQ